MRALIDLGISILLMAIVTKNLPSILKGLRRAQIAILMEATTSKWGKAWVPD